MSRLSIEISSMRFGAGFYDVNSDEHIRLYRVILRLYR